jgi:muramoyltetrapeptide carboxypeptidase
MIDRRKFLFLGAAGIIASNTLKSKNLLPQTVGVYDSQPNQKNIIIPKRLKEGSKVAITAPASPTSMGEIAHGIKTFKSLACEVVVGDTITKQKNNHRYFSGTENQRIDELMSFIQDESIDAIICGRGGYGVMRILDKIDYEIIRNNPKIILGFSDITALLNSIYAKSGVVSYHGPVASSSFNSYTISNIKDVFFTNENLRFKDNNAISLNSGVAEGRLVGGNLQMIVSTLGTPYEIDTTDSILFLEDVGEHPYKIDRMLTQLKLAGKLDTCNGFVFGIFKDLNERKPFYPNYSYTLKEVVEQLIVPFNKPVLMNMPIGHIENKLTLPIGINSVINSDSKYIELIENPVA